MGIIDLQVRAEGLRVCFGSVLCAYGRANEISNVCSR